VNGSLYVTGRRKEILIVGGRNYYPQELEAVAGTVPGVRSGRAVAFAVHDSEQATESVVVLVETALTARNEREDLRRRVRVALVEAGYPVAEVGLLPPKTIETTATGKVKRVECRTRYLAGEFADVENEVGARADAAMVPTDAR
jgi:acyl-CoA synthetase (AMP-forming)/AMP-acid ligase II